MYLKLSPIIVLIIISGYVYSATVDDNQDIVVSVIQKICGPNADQNKVKIVKECQRKEPDYIRNASKTCIKQLYNVTEIREPYICYMIKQKEQGRKVFNADYLLIIILMY